MIRLLIRLFLVSSFAYLFLLGNNDQLFGQNQDEKSYKKLTQAQQLFDRGIPYLNAGQHDSATYCFQGSLDIFHKIKNREGVLSSGIYLAIALKNQGRLPELLGHEDALNSYLNESDSLFTQIQLSMGAAHFAKGNYLAALRYLKKSEYSFEDQISSNFALLLQIHRNQAQVYRKLGCPAYELNFYQDILQLHTDQRVNIPEEELLTLYVYMARAFANTYQAAASRKHLILATQLLKEKWTFSEKNKEAWIYTQIGDVYELLGAYEEASKVFKQKIQLLKKDDPAYASTIFRLGKLAFLSKRYEHALDTLNLSASLLEADSSRNKEHLAESYFLMGESHRIPNPYRDQSSPSLYDANQIALEQYQKVLALWVEGYEGNSVNKIPELTQIPQTKMAHDLLWSYAMALKNQLPYADADALFQVKRCLAAYQKAMELGDFIRQNNHIEEIELIPLDSLSSRYEGAIEIALLLYEEYKDDRYLGIAFQFQQRKKSSENRELFWGYFRKNGYAWSLDEQTERRNYIVRLKDQEEKLKYVKSKDEKKLIHGQIRNIDGDYDSFIYSFSYAHPEYFALKNQKDYTDIGELRAHIQRGEIVLSFFEGKRFTFVFSLSKNKLTVNRIEKSQLQSDIKVFLEQLTSPHTHIENFTHRASAVYEKLIAPSLPDTLNSLVIIPDGILHYLPVETLISSPTPSAGFADLAYLIKKFPIRYVNHSIDLLPSPYVSPSKDAQSRYAVFLPSYEEEASEWMDSLQLSSEEQVEVSLPFMPSLKDQEKELEKRLSLMKGDAFMSEKTTKHKFGRYAPRYYSIDIAGYALSTDYQPIHSGLAFANHTEGENFLDAYEIAQNQYPNDLITLPNHNSLGKKINGRGIKALLGAFHLAQSKNISLSLWQVNGNSNQELLSEFYKNLYAGFGKAHALQEAKLSFLASQNARQHPYYWSSLVLYGDNIELKGEERPWWSYGALFFALFMVMLIVFGFRRKRRRR